MFENLVAVRRDKKIYREGNKLVKLFDENYSKSNVLNEAINQARVEETGLNIPKIREVTVIDGKWAISMDYIEGETVLSEIGIINPSEEILARCETLKNLGPEGDDMYSRYWKIFKSK